MLGFYYYFIPPPPHFYHCFYFLQYTILKIWLFLGHLNMFDRNVVNRNVLNYLIENIAKI